MKMILGLYAALPKLRGCGILRSLCLVFGVGCGVVDFGLMTNCRENSCQSEYRLGSEGREILAREECLIASSGSPTQFLSLACSRWACWKMSLVLGRKMYIMDTRQTSYWLSTREQVEELVQLCHY